MFAVTGLVLHYARLATESFPAIVATQAQRIVVADHQPLGIAEAAHGIAVAVDHRADLALFVIAVLIQDFDRFTSLIPVRVPSVV